MKNVNTFFLSLINHLQILILLLPLFLLQSCDVNEVTNEVLDSGNFNKNSVEITFKAKTIGIERGILNFKSFEELDFVRRKLMENKGNSDFWNELIQSKDFTPIFEFYNTLNDDFYERLILNKEYEWNSDFVLVTLLNEPTIELGIPEYDMQMILNRNRQVIVGESLLTFYYDFYESLDINTGLKQKKNLFRGGVKDTSLRRATGNGYAVQGFYTYGGKNYRYFIESDAAGFNSNHFYKAKLKNKHQKKFSGIYFNSKCTQIHMNGVAESGVYLPPYSNEMCGQNWQNFSYGAYCTSCSKAETDLKNWTSNAPCYLNINASTTFICADGQGRSLSLFHSSPY